MSHHLAVRRKKEANLALDHKTIRIRVCDGFKIKFGREATLQEAQFLHAIGMLETSCGTGWKGAGAGSFNMGAIIAGNGWTGKTFEYRDSYPDENGVDHWYTTKFRKYASEAEGWADLANIMYEDRPTVLKAATDGDAYGVSAALYATKYYAGRGKTAKERIAGHHSALTRNLITLCRVLNEALPNGQDVPPPTIKRGDVGEDVKVVQIWLGLVNDGVFGPVLEQEVIKFQRANGLEDDGIVGPKTWEVLDAEFDNANEVKSNLETYIGDLVTKATALRADLDVFVAASQKERTE